MTHYRLEHRDTGWRQWRVQWQHPRLGCLVATTFRTRKKAERFIERQTAREESRRWREVS